MNLDQAQIILKNYLDATFTPSAFDPLIFEGVTAGSEFLTYAATKLYMALEFSGYTAGTTAQMYVQFNNNADVMKFIAGNNVAYWNNGTAVVAYGPNVLQLKNIWFSRIIVSNVAQIKFIGYKLTY